MTLIKRVRTDEGDMIPGWTREEVVAGVTCVCQGDALQQKKIREKKKRIFFRKMGESGFGK